MLRASRRGAEQPGCSKNGFRRSRNRAARRNAPSFKVGSKSGGFGVSQGLLTLGVMLAAARSLQSVRSVALAARVVRSAVKPGVVLAKLRQSSVVSPKAVSIAASAQIRGSAMILARVGKRKSAAVNSLNNR